METRKLKEKIPEIETQDYAEFSPADPTAAPSEGRNKRKRVVMPEESAEEGGSRKAKKLKSKSKKVSSGNPNKSGSTATKRTSSINVYDDIEAKYLVAKKVERLLESLQCQLPSFTKCMLPSNVSHGFWLHLPKEFCSAYLPDHDTSITLVDEWGNEYTTSYLLGRHGLSAGWRAFSILHGLIKGDVLLFHLIEPCKFKVHIVRVNDQEVIDGALCLMKMKASGRGTGADSLKKDKKKRARRKYVEPIIGTAADQSSNSAGSSSKCFESMARPQSTDRCHPETSNLNDHSPEGVPCR